MAVASAATAPAAQTLDRVLAVVSGQVILASDVRAFLELGLISADTSDRFASEEVALTRLIERRLALDEVDRYRPPPPSPARIEQDLAAIRARFPDEAAFSEVLAVVGLDLDDVRQIVRDDARLRAYLAARFGDAAGMDPPRPAAVADWLAGLQRRVGVARFDRPR